MRIATISCYLIAAIIGVSAMILPQPSLAQGSSAMLEEVVVTARKREENIQDAPLAVSAFTGGKDLSRVFKQKLFPFDD